MADPREIKEAIVEAAFAKTVMEEMLWEESNGSLVCRRSDQR
jgi:hypothetical protein